MFVEKKQNKSGSTSVRIIQKVHGKRKCVKVIGCSSDAEDIGLLVKRGSRWIEEHQAGVPLFEFDDEAVAYDKVLAGLRQSQLRLVGPELIYGTLFDRIGYEKASVNNRGYNRLLTLKGETTVTIDQNKIAEDARLDGLKGYVTNSKIKDKEVVENYRNLFFIERAFRMNKTDLAIRPIYHRLFNRIEAHVCICFTAYTILLELERILKKTEDKKNKIPGITIYRAKFLAESLYEIEYVTPLQRQKHVSRASHRLR